MLDPTDFNHIPLWKSFFVFFFGNSVAMFLGVSPNCLRTDKRLYSGQCKAGYLLEASHTTLVFVESTEVCIVIPLALIEARSGMSAHDRRCH